jgi:hypothetical protein
MIYENTDLSSWDTLYVYSWEMCESVFHLKMDDSRLAETSFTNI